MQNQTTRERLLASTMIGGVTLIAAASATQASAQTAPSGDNTVSEVVVTGSRIPQPNLTSASPITVVNDQELKLQGTTNVESLLNNLPQVFADQSGSVANGASGTATVNLRGLGPERTLVLVDGRRLMPGDPALPVADLNNIPAGLVQRVDVLTGGASAVYGSDAIAGVVNFVMKRDFEGVQIDAQYGFAQHNNNNGLAQSVESQSPYPVNIPKGSVTDGGTTDVTLLMGTNTADGKGNVTAYASYRHIDAVLQSTRDYSACSLSAYYTSDPTIYDTRMCAGSSNSAHGRFATNDPVTGAKISSNLSLNPDGSKTFVPYTGGLAYNYGPQNYFQRPDDRYTAGYFAHYQINKHFDVYSDFMFADDHTVAQIAPSGFFRGTGSNGTSTFKLNCDNPLMSASQATALCGAYAGTSTQVDAQIGLRFAAPALAAGASFPRQDDLRHTNYKITVGTKGELGDGWTYDAYLQYGTSIYSEHYLNDVSVSKAQNALLVDPTTGQCMVGATSGCVPLNIFQQGGITQDQLNYVVTPGFKSGQTTEQVASFSTTGDLGQYGVKTPWSQDGIGVALGAEYRRESLDLKTDNEFTTGDLAGQGGPTLGNGGSFDVYELFGEARIPIIQDMQFAKELSMEAGYRFSDYNTAAGVTNTYKVAGTWAPIDDIKFRASYNRAVRAPNVVEMFAPSSVGLFGGADPCAAGLITGTVKATLAQCERSGVTPTQYAQGIEQCPSGQCTALLGGNPDLKAEKSDTYSVGVVLRPSFFRGFDMTIDYFDIKVENLISSLPNLTVVDCVLNGNTAACANFHRDPTNGAIFGNEGYIIATKVNTGFLKTSGIDINANYRTKFSDWGLGDWGQLQFNFTGTWTRTYETQPSTGGGTFDCVGLYGPVCSSNANLGPTPEWRHKFRMTWVTPWPVTLSFDWRHVSGVDFDGNQSNTFLADPLGRTDVVDAHIPAYDWFDFSGTWKVRDNLTFRAGVNNVTDKDPPFLDSTAFPASGPPAGNGNTYPGTYDYLGRTIFVGLTADF